MTRLTRGQRQRAAAGAPAVPGDAQSYAPEPVDLLLVATITYVLVSVAHVNAMFPFLLKLRPAIISAVLAAGLYVMSAHGRRSFARLFAERSVQLVAFLFVWSIVTIPVALNDGASFRFVLDNFSKTVVLFVLVVGVLRGPRDLERYALWYFLGTVMYATYALQNMEALVGDWRMEDLSLGGYDPNDFAVFCVSGLPLAIHFIRQRGPVWVRLVSAYGIYALAAAIVASGSRGGFIATAAVGIFVLVRFRSVKLGWRVGGIAAAVLVISMTASDRYWEQMRTIINPEEDYNVTELGRLGIWKRGIGYVGEFPLTGVGIMNFGFAEGTVSTQLQRLREQGIQVGWTAPHNTYVQVAAELGIPGMIAFLALLVASWRSMSRGAREDLSPRLRSLVQAMKASTAGVLVGIFFLSHAYTPMLYAVLGFAAATAKVLATHRDAAAADRAPAPPRRAGRPALGRPAAPLGPLAAPPR